jgi:TolC family type I secretion outer membrane protein
LKNRDWSNSLKTPFVRGGTAIAVAAVLAASPASAQTFKEALVAAYANNPTLQSARAQLRATDEQVPQARSNYFPTVTGTGDLGRTSVEQESAFFGSSQIRNPREAQVVISEPLYRGGRTQAELERAENSVKAGRAQLVSTEQSVLLAAATAYLDVYRDQAVLQLNINNEQVLTRQLEETEEQFKVGVVTQTDVAQAKARLSQAKAARLAAEGTLNSTRAVFRNVTGITPGTLEGPDPVGPLPGTNEEAVAASTENPDVIAASFNELAARNDVDLNAGELLPTLSLNGAYDRGEDTLSRDSFVDSKSITAELSVPIYPGSAVYSRVRQAKQTVQQRRSDTETATRNAAQAAAQAYEALTSAQAQVKSFEAQIDANQIALTGVRQEATVGTRTVLDILNAEQELLNSQVSKVGAEHDATVAAFQLKVAIGQLTAQNLSLPVDLYDVDRHYEEVRGKLWGTGEDIR